MGSSGPGDFFSKGSRRGYHSPEAIPGGVKDLKDTNGVKSLSNIEQTRQLGDIKDLKGHRDIEGVDRLSETK